MYKYLCLPLHIYILSLFDARVLRIIANISCRNSSFVCMKWGFCTQHLEPTALFVLFCYSAFTFLPKPPTERKCYIPWNLHAVTFPDIYKLPTYDMIENIGCIFFFSNSSLINCISHSSMNKEYVFYKSWRVSRLKWAV